MQGGYVDHLGGFAVISGLPNRRGGGVSEREERGEQMGGQEQGHKEIRYWVRALRMEEGLQVGGCGCPRTWAEPRMNSALRASRRSQPCQ